MEDILALDIALRRNDRAWLEVLPPGVSKLVHKLYYGHFFMPRFPSGLYCEEAWIRMRPEGNAGNPEHAQGGISGTET